MILNHPFLSLSSCDLTKQIIDFFISKVQDFLIVVKVGIYENLTIDFGLMKF